MLESMKAPLFVRPWSDAEQKAVEAGLRSSDAFVLRRCQFLLDSSRGEHASHIARILGCSDQTVRNAIKAFNQQGVQTLKKGSSRPYTVHVTFDAQTFETLRDLIHRSPREFGKETSVWTLDLVAEVSSLQGLTPHRVSGETIRATLVRFGLRWRRAKKWITSPDPAYTQKKRQRDRVIRWVQAHPEWALGFADEVWWSRVTQPNVHTWAEADQPLRLVEQTLSKEDHTPRALACYGLLQPKTNELWLRFVDGRPVSAITTQFLSWCCGKLAAQGKTALLLIWDNASWHKSQEVRAWLRAHNQQVKQTGKGVRILACLPPTKSRLYQPD
jgi:transposase